MPPNGAVARGRLVHRLMQALPELPPERRADAARRHCDRLGAIAGAEPMVARLLRLFDDPRFAALFASGSRAEVPIVGRLPGFGEPILVSGQVDRLAITSEAVLIADYKTNSPPPATVAQVPGPYITQLALYRAVLRQLYPDRTVRTALIWTEGPDLMEISDAALDRALAAVTSA
jgi:ATP-dependent helicase/nuclease subunit A